MTRLEIMAALYAAQIAHSGSDFVVSNSNVERSIRKITNRILTEDAEHRERAWQQAIAERGGTIALK